MQYRLIALALSASMLAACAMGGNNTMSGAPDAMPSRGSASGMDNPMVGGAAMFATRDIIDNAVNSRDHTTLVAAVKAAGLVETLKGAGPFTVFAPTDAAFDALPAGTVEALLEPDMKADLASLLTYHVVPGRLDSAALATRARAGGGSATLATVQGESLRVSMRGDALVLTDGKGAVAGVAIADVRQSNGVIHVVDRVLMP